MSRDRQFMMLNVGDLAVDTLHLNATEFGAYMRLILHCWQHGSIPRDSRRLALIAHCDTRLWHQYEKTVLQFFDSVDASTMHNKRVSTERARCAEISNKRKAAAVQKHMQSASKRGANGSIRARVHNTTQGEEALKRASSPESLPLASESERSPDDGELASAMGDARRSPPSVDPPPKPPEESKRPSEEERAAHVARVLGVKPKRFPESDHPPIAPTPAADLVAEEPPIKPSVALLQTPLVQKANGHANLEAPLSRAEVGKPEGWDWEPPRKKLSKMSLDALLAEPDDNQEKVA